MFQPLYPWERDPVHIVQEAGQTSGLVWKGYGKAHPKGVRTLDHPALSQLQYRLRHPGCHFMRNLLLFSLALQLSAGYGLLPVTGGFLITHNDAPQSVGLLWTIDQLVAETST
jgi:hypothetical protein